SSVLHVVFYRAIDTCYSIVLATEPLPPVSCQLLIKHIRAASDTKRLLYYFRRTADNRMVFGCSGRTASKRDARSLYDKLREGMVTIFPGLKDAKAEYKWSGKAGYTFEKRPYSGRLEDGNHYVLRN